MNAINNDQAPFEVFYDSHCPMCKTEIEMIRRKDKKGRMKLTDISANNFNAASTGKTLDELMREIHGRYADGTIVIGVEVFREIYGRLGFGFLVKPTRWAIIRWPMDLGYRLFASIRYRRALKRYNKNSCELPVAAFPDSTVAN
jgi:predicted DCC family thiol-disulfide oxidoreductase YuxK